MVYKVSPISKSLSKNINWENDVISKFFIDYKRDYFFNHILSKLKTKSNFGNFQFYEVSKKAVDNSLLLSTSLFFLPYKKCQSFDYTFRVKQLVFYNNIIYSNKFKLVGMRVCISVFFKSFSLAFNARAFIILSNPFIINLSFFGTDFYLYNYVKYFKNYFYNSERLFVCKAQKILIFFKNFIYFTNFFFNLKKKILNILRYFNKFLLLWQFSIKFVFFCKNIYMNYISFFFLYKYALSFNSLGYLRIFSKLYSNFFKKYFFKTRRSSVVTAVINSRVGASSISYLLFISQYFLPFTGLSHNFNGNSPALFDYFWKVGYSSNLKFWCTDYDLDVNRVCYSNFLFYKYSHYTFNAFFFIKHGLLVNFLVKLKAQSLLKKVDNSLYYFNDSKLYIRNLDNDLISCCYLVFTRFFEKKNFIDFFLAFKFGNIMLFSNLIFLFLNNKKKNFKGLFYNLKYVLGVLFKAVSNYITSIKIVSKGKTSKKLRSGKSEIKLGSYLHNNDFNRISLLKKVPLITKYGCVGLNIYFGLKDHKLIQILTLLKQKIKHKKKLQTSLLGFKNTRGGSIGYGFNFEFISYNLF